MDNPNKSADILSLTRGEKVALVKEKIEEVKKELGVNYSFISKTRICSMVQEKLPLRPLYDLGTIDMIMSGTYC